MVKNRYDAIFRGVYYIYVQALTKAIYLADVPLQFLSKVCQTYLTVIDAICHGDGRDDQSKGSKGERSSIMVCMVSQMDEWLITCIRMCNFEKWEKLIPIIGG